MKFTDNELSLRRFQPTDKETLVRLADNAHIAQWLADMFPHPYRPEDADQWLERTKMETRPCNFAIEWKGELAGGIGLVPLADIHSGTAELGYWLGEPYWGQGIATRAVALLLSYAFDELLFIRVHAQVFAENRASMRVLEKNGFVKEGVLRKHIRKNGVITDAVLYAKLRN